MRRVPICAPLILATLLVLLVISAEVQAYGSRVLVGFSVIKKAEELELSYDDGEDEVSAWTIFGHAVRFTVNDWWVILKVKVYGWLSGVGSKGFHIEIWDEKLSLLYESPSYKCDEYFNEYARWAEIEIPSLNIFGDFYVCVFTDGGVYVGIDRSPPFHERSYIAYSNYTVSRDPHDTWFDPNRDKWMIRLEGPPDTRPPEVWIKEPIEGDTVTGNVTIIVDVTDNIAIRSISFFIDGKSKKTCTCPPWQWSWDTTLDEDGQHKIEVFAYDVAMNKASRNISVAVDNVKEQPWHRIFTNPIVIAAIISGAFLLIATIIKLRGKKKEGHDIN